MTYNMHILTFDIEDWFCHDNYSGNKQWDKLEVRIHDGVEKILISLAERNLKGTFFCLGWIAENQPEIIKMIKSNGHHIGCHSYQHELVFRHNKESFRQETERSKNVLEDLTGDEVNAYRAPSFSITHDSLFAFDVLIELGFKYDCSVFDAEREAGGIPGINIKKPSIIQRNFGTIKEFPMSPYKLGSWDIIYSGGGYFRIIPYQFIKNITKKSDYVMTYFHPSDFDPDQPDMPHLTYLRRWKNRVGLKNSYSKFNKYLSDFNFINVEEADKLINWSNANCIKL
jgi:polysaccharide deacetylase family protein (PEP-CTERM system associated)